MPEDQRYRSAVRLGARVLGSMEWMEQHSCDEAEISQAVDRWLSYVEWMSELFDVEPWRLKKDVAAAAGRRSS